MRHHRRRLSVVGPAVPDAGGTTVRHSRTYAAAAGRRHRRPGLSLTEVLVALFVMALGLMALLTLFPLGAMQVGQALKDDRTAQTAHQADAWLRVWWKDATAVYRTDPDALPTADPALLALDEPNAETLGFRANSPNPDTLFFQAPTAGAAPAMLPYFGGTANGLQNAPNGSYATTSTGMVPYTMQANTTNLTNSATQRFVRRGGSRLTSTPAGAAAASYPVVLDPLGYLARSSMFEKAWVGLNSTGNTAGVYGANPTNATPLLLPRRNTAATPGPSPFAAFNVCALTDDLTYQPNGGTGQTITNEATGLPEVQPLGRQGRYTWAAVVQRPDNRYPDRASLTVLVFDGRPPFLGVAGEEVVLANDGGSSNFVPGGIPANARSLTLNVPTRGADAAPLVRRGGWLAVVSMDRPGTGNNTRRVTFHRVTGLTTLDETTVPQYAGGPAVNVTPVAVDIDPPVPSGVSPAAHVLLLSGLSEVFLRADLTGN